MWTRLLPEDLVRLSLQFLGGCFSTRMGLHMRIKSIEFFYAHLARGFSFDGGAELLKMHADTVQREAGLAIRTNDSTHRAPRNLKRAIKEIIDRFQSVLFK